MRGERLPRSRARGRTYLGRKGPLSRSMTTALIVVGGMCVVISGCGSATTDKTSRTVAKRSAVLRPRRPAPCHGRCVLVGWGNSHELAHGMLCHPDEGCQQKTPAAVAGLSHIAAVVVNDNNGLNTEATYALQSDGTVVAWGGGGGGALGNGAEADSDVPVVVSGLSHVVAIGGGGNIKGGGTGYAVRSDGTLWAWGDNDNGQLGNGTTSSSDVPVRVLGLAHVVQAAGSTVAGYALKSDGSVWAWGDNVAGALGTGRTCSPYPCGSNTPVQVRGLRRVVAIASSGGSAYALDATGHVSSWGFNAQGQLGNGTTVPSGRVARIAGLTRVVAISAGGENGYAVRADGSVWAWGYNGAGQLGNSSAGPDGGSPVPVKVAGVPAVSRVSGGGNGVVALARSGAVWSWGGVPLGTATYQSGYVPTRASGIGDAVGVAAGDAIAYALQATAQRGAAKGLG